MKPVYFSALVVALGICAWGYVKFYQFTPEPGAVPQAEIREPATVTPVNTGRPLPGPSHSPMEHPPLKKEQTAQAADGHQVISPLTQGESPPLTEPANPPAKKQVENELESIIRQYHKDGDEYSAYHAILFIKEALEGEDIQTALKLMNQWGHIGGNQVLVETALDPYTPMNDLDRIRILSYVNPEHPLPEYHLDSLAFAVGNPTFKELRPHLLMTIAQAGGDAGAGMLMDMARSTGGAPRKEVLNALGHSGSDLALGYLNQALDGLVNETPEYQDPELIALVRTLIRNRR